MSSPGLPSETPGFDLSPTGDDRLALPDSRWQDTERGDRQNEGPVTKSHVGVPPVPRDCVEDPYSGPISVIRHSVDAGPVLRE